MSKLNSKNDFNKKNIHIMVTSLCKRNCKYCCNKQYSLNDVEYVTDEELREAENIFITGGEPFAFADPCNIAKYYKQKYVNIKKVYVYTNAVELAEWLENNELHHIDGLTVSIKCKADRVAFEKIVKNHGVLNINSNLVYVFDNLYPENCGNFIVKDRVWQEEFVANPDSIFRKI